MFGTGDRLLGLGDRIGGNRDARDAPTYQVRDEFGILGRGFSTDDAGESQGFGRMDQLAQCSEYSGVTGGIGSCPFGVVAIDCQEQLRKVIGADADALHPRLHKVCQLEENRWHFCHDPDFEGFDFQQARFLDPVMADAKFFYRSHEGK